MQLLGLLPVRDEDAGRGNSCAGNYELADKAPASRPHDEGPHLSTFYSSFLQPHLEFWLCEFPEDGAVLIEPIEQSQGAAQLRSYLVLCAGA
ncbi:hypothetical protein AB0G64_26695 [Streptomyces longwoodensis]|uniref:hypothetical protein n=1 Tax=Streptomyces longwoodensis TaxID=68231 RepID=UPI0033FCE74A